MSIAKNQDSNQPIVLNYEDPILREYAGKLTNRIIWFSSKQKVNPGVYLEGKNIIYADGKKETFVTTTEDTTLVGIHNVENIWQQLLFLLIWMYPLSHYNKLHHLLFPHILFYVVQP